jgi:DNA-binding MarR family transcriptional regulator
LIVVRDQDLPAAVNSRLSYLFKRAALELAELQDEALAPLGLSHGEHIVLLSLDAGEPHSQQEMGRRAGVDRTTMVALIDGLEDKGLVARRPDDADRRRNVVELTSAGRATLRRATKAGDKAEARLLAGLDDAEAAQLRSLLRRVAADSDRLHPP